MRQALMLIARTYSILDQLKETVKSGVEAYDVVRALHSLELAGHRLINLQVERRCFECIAPSIVGTDITDKAPIVRDANTGGSEDAKDRP